MKNYIIFGLFILISVQGFAQSAIQSTKHIHKILLDNDIIPYQYKGVYTADGLFISVTEKIIIKNIETRSARIFLYTADKKFNEVQSLSGYVIEDYSPNRNELLLGKLDIVRSRSTICGKFYTYNLSTNKFTLQYDLEGDNHTDRLGAVEYSHNYDSIVIKLVKFGVDDFRNVERKLK